MLSSKGFGPSGGGKSESFSLRRCNPTFGRGEYESLLFAHEEARIRETSRHDARVCTDDRMVIPFGWILLPKKRKGRMQFPCFAVLCVYDASEFLWPNLAGYVALPHIGAINKLIPKPVRWLGACLGLFRAA